MNTRLVKQLLYGAGYIVFFALSIFFFYWIFLRPAPLPVDPNAIPANLSLPRVTSIQYFRAGEETILALEMQNPNIDYASDMFTYTITLLGKNTAALQTLTNTSIIYAGEIKNIVLTASVETNDIASADISFLNVHWQHKADFLEPQMQTRDIKTELGGTNTSPTVTGYVANKEAFSLGRVSVIALLFNAGGAEVSASKTTIEHMDPFEERSFTVSFPKNVVVAAPQSPAATPLFVKNISLGARGDDVLRLQQFLIAQMFLAGEATNYFGKSIETALMKYQKTAGISPANGSLGPKTREVINKELTIQALAAEKDDPNAADPEKTKVYVEAVK